MKRIILAMLMLILSWVPAIAGGGLDGFLNNVNLQALAHLSGFSF